MSASRNVASFSARFLSSMSVKFSRGSFLWRKDGVLVDTKLEGADKASMAGRAEADGVEVYAQVEKSRTCRPLLVGLSVRDGQQREEEAGPADHRALPGRPPRRREALPRKAIRPGAGAGTSTVVFSASTSRSACPSLTSAPGATFTSTTSPLSTFSPSSGS